MKDKFIVNTSAIIVNDKGEILITQRSLSEDVFPGYWGIPGGTLDKEDKDLETSLKRELMEEVGIEISNIQLVQNNTVTREDGNKLYLVFLAKYMKGEPRTSDEVEKVEWRSFTDLKDLQMTPYTYELLEELYNKGLL